MSTLGERIRQRREELQLQLEGLAVRSGLPVELLDSLERNEPQARQKLSGRTLLQLARALGVSIDWLMTGAAAPAPAAVVIFCSRGANRRRCKECGARASKLCDYPLSGKHEGKTCDVLLCARCAVSVRRNRDYCPAHARALERNAP